jgi:GIY-YIG catalytic domain
MAAHTIYAIESLTDGRSYVGTTGYVDSRRKTHLSWTSNKTAIGRAIREQGADTFTFRVLAECKGKREAELYERLFIHLLESNDPQFGYNSPRIYAVR